MHSAGVSEIDIKPESVIGVSVTRLVTRYFCEASGLLIGFFMLCLERQSICPSRTLISRPTKNCKAPYGELRGRAMVACWPTAPVLVCIPTQTSPAMSNPNVQQKTCKVILLAGCWRRSMIILVA